MKLFLDSANLEDIRYWKRFGLVEGVTTNPQLLAREKKEPLHYLRAICNEVEGPVCAQVTWRGWRSMVDQARALAAVSDNIVVKIPATLEGYRAIQELNGEIKIAVTFNFNQAQTAIFSRLKVWCVAVIWGRMEQSGIRFDRGILSWNQHSKVLIASLNNVVHLSEALQAGADILTVPPTTWKQFFQNAMTLQMEKDFLEAFEGLPKNMRADYEMLGRKEMALP